MVKILILTACQQNMQHWVDALNKEYCVTCRLQFKHDKSLLLFDVVIIDYAEFKDKYDFFEFDENITKSIMVGDSLTSEEQVKIIAAGARGYAEKNISSNTINKVIDSVLNGELWVGRQIVPQLIHSLIETKRDIKGAKVQKLNIKIIDELFCLSLRELEVVEWIYEGENYTNIAIKMGITERTVKAHLSSIYNKLNVKDRFHLMVFLKNAHLEMMT